MVERGDPSSTKEKGVSHPHHECTASDVQTFRDFDSQLPYHARWGTLLENEWRGHIAVRRWRRAGPERKKRRAGPERKQRREWPERKQRREGPERRKVQVGRS